MAASGNGLRTRPIGLGLSVGAGGDAEMVGAPGIRVTGSIVELHIQQIIGTGGRHRSSPKRLIEPH
jgi:hypothetical protein